MVLTEQEHAYMDAFWELSSCRSLGYGAMGPIPWSAVDQYASNVLGVTCLEDEVAYEDFRYAMQACDEAFLEVQHEKAKKLRPKGE